MVHYIDHLNRGLDDAGVGTAAALPDAVERRRDAVLGRDRRRPHGAHAVLRPRRRRAGRAPISPRTTRAPASSPSTWAAPRPTSPSSRAACRSKPPRAMIARRQIDVPALDMTSISAGGGSIAWVDGGGFLNVGPQSAGADPGPACYGRGGTRPTVTDADIVCGYLNPDYFLGGAQTLDVAAARAALKAHVADPLKMDVLEAAAGIQRIVDMRMADEVRVFAAKRGVDLSAFTLLPFGGAGAVHAAAVAAGARHAAHSGAAAAGRVLGAGPALHRRGARLHPLRAAAARRGRRRARRGAFSASSKRKAREELAAEGMDPAAARFARELDLRYTGQGYELRTPLDGLFTDRLTADVARGGARALRRAPRADPRPRRQGAAGRGGELSRARARHGAEIRAARGAGAGRRRAAATSPSRASARIHFGGKHIGRGDALRARPARHRQRPSTGPPSSSSSTPPPSSRQAGPGAWMGIAI